MSLISATRHAGAGPAIRVRRGSMDARAKPAHDEERRASGLKPGRSLCSRPPPPARETAKRIYPAAILAITAMDGGK